jgi:hypothetical protein
MMDPAVPHNDQPNHGLHAAGNDTDKCCGGRTERAENGEDPEGELLAKKGSGCPFRTVAPANAPRHIHNQHSERIRAIGGSSVMNMAALP